MESEKPQPNDLWVEHGLPESYRWHVIDVFEGNVHLSGPGNCSGYKRVPMEKFMNEWRCVIRWEEQKKIYGF